MSSSLSLLNDYGSEDSEEDISTQNCFQASRLPLPNSFKLIPKEELRDDPVRHDGRIRSYPHQRGNWNSLVYIPYEKNNSYDLFCDQIIEHCQPKIHLKQIEEPHISLSRTFILLYHWIDDFIASVKSTFQTFLSYNVQFDSVKIYCNEEKSRTFLALSVGFGKMEISKSAQLLDGCLSDYNLQPFYKEASFHMSVLWCLGDKRKELEDYLQDINKIFEACLNDSFDVTVPVAKYVCKVGHKLYSINLK